jgi:hypothetical protein
MDIRKTASCSRSLVFYLSLAIVIMLTAEEVSPTEAKTPAEVLIATYRSPHATAPAGAKSAIAELERALANCEDAYLAFRIRYRIGVMHFRAGMIGASKAGFLQIANDPKCPELIRACSFNMIGQISRLRAENKDALEALGRVADLLEQRLSIGRGYAPNSTMAKLWCSAFLSRAEIYELQRDYAASITEYSRLLHALSQSKSEHMQSQYAPLANDRMSQLCLRQGDTDRYTELAEALTGRYPEYCRTPIVRLELECVKFLRSVSPKLEFPHGSFSAPAHVIAHLKRSDDGTSPQSVVDKLNGLCKEYRNTRGGMLLQYHYAWLLDTLGEKRKAAEVFARIFSNDAVNANSKSEEKVIAETVQEYAKIQYAIMAGEKADYREALKVLSSLKAHPDKSHLSELAESVTKGVQTLIREVPRNENEER